MWRNCTALIEKMNRGEPVYTADGVRCCLKCSSPGHQWKTCPVMNAEFKTDDQVFYTPSDSDAGNGAGPGTFPGLDFLPMS